MTLPVLPATRWTYCGLSVTPLPETRRQVVGGTVIDIRIHDPFTTATYATVNVDTLTKISATRASDSTTILIVHHDAQDSTLYWCGHGNGHDGQGWTAERAEAMTFPSFSAANLERKVCRRMHPTMRVTLQVEGDES